MVQGADLYPILLSYANKNNSPYINIDSFLEYLEKTARKYSNEYPIWNKWVQEKGIKFWSEMSILVEEGKCELLSESESEKIFMSEFYPGKVGEAYRYVDENEDLPFLNEEILGLSIPENQIKRFNSEYDLHSILFDPQKADVPLLLFIFPENFGCAIILRSMIPKQLTEIAILKIRSYLRYSGNKEYSLHKLTAQLHGKESFIKDQLDQIVIRPVDLFKGIEESGELTSAFWAHFCSLIKSDISKKKDRQPKDVAAFQAAHFIQVVNGYFRTLAIKRQEMEAAFKNLEERLAKPPYIYTMADILKFTNPNGAPLTKQYTVDDLNKWIKKQTTECIDNKLPVLLFMRGSSKDEQYFLLKDRMLPLCAKLLSEARLLIKNKIFKHWGKMILDFRSEAAMEYDDEFETALHKLTENYCPAFASLLNDPKFPLVYEEMDQKENGVPSNARVFYKGKLLPYSTLFSIRRKAMLAEAKYALPFWYSMPFFYAIIGFFKRLKEKKKNARAVIFQEANSGQDILEEDDRAGEIKSAAEDLELDMVPPGYSIDLYLEELEDRWSRLVNRKAREDLIYDVKCLAKEKLRRTLQLHKQFKPTRDTINQIADDLVVRNNALASISARDSLVFYVELYMVKLLLNIK